MVTDMRAKRRIVILGASSALGRRLGEAYAGEGNEVVGVDVTSANLEDVASSCKGAPVDLLVIADDLDIDGVVTSADRDDMRDLLYRLTYAPFRFATLLRPALALAGGCVLVCSRRTALMEREPVGGRFIDRPFRAAAHALWKCLDVEWKDEDIRLRIVALDNLDAVTPASIERAGAVPAPLLVDVSGLPLQW